MRGGKYAITQLGQTLGSDFWGEVATLANAVEEGPQEPALDPELEAQPTQPVDIRTFIKDPEYCGLEGFWEEPLKELERILAPGCKGAVIEKGIRGSKSYTTCMIPVYLTYCLLFEEVVLGKDPRLKYGLDPQATAIYNAIFTVNGALAKNLFNYISNFVSCCKWFHRDFVTSRVRLNDKITTKLLWCRVVDGKPRWDEVRYCIYPGTSKLTSAAGVALYSYILDECNLFTVAESSGSSGKDYAEELDEELDMRVTSSFGQGGRRLYISRRQTINDFTSRKKAKWQSLRVPEVRYYTPPASTSWAGWPREKHTIEDEEGNPREALWRLFEPSTCEWVYGDDSKPLTLGYEDAQEARGLWVPEVFWDNFESNPEGALKVLASIPGEALDPYFKRIDLIIPNYGRKAPSGKLIPATPNPIRATTMPRDWMDPHKRFDDLVTDDFYGHPDRLYHFHCDLALRRDNAGLAIASNFGTDAGAWVTSGARQERAAMIEIPAAFCIASPRSGEISFARIRELIYWLKDERGFRFRTSSYDGWQSTDSIQTLNSKGMDVEILSVDRNLDAYDTFKSAMYEGRLYFPAPLGLEAYWDEEAGRWGVDKEEVYDLARQGDPIAIMMVECYQLEIKNGKKVDHPPHGSKDVSDAVAGAVYWASTYRRAAID